MEDYSKESTVNLITTLTHLDNKIDLLLLERELIRKTLVDRFPQLNNSEEFKPKIKSIGGNNNGTII